MAIELNVYGCFEPGPWKYNSAAIVRAASEGAWSPATVELREFATSAGVPAEEAPNVWNLLRAIVRKKPDRINIFTHANDKFVYLKGTVVRNNVTWDDKADENRIDPKFLWEREGNNYTFSVGKSREYSFKEFRDALPPYAIMHVYACNMALNPELCKDIANFFQCGVRGFREKIRYDVSLDKKRNLVLKYGVEHSPPYDDYRGLDRFLTATFYPSKTTDR